MANEKLNHGIFSLKEGNEPREIILAFRGEFNFMSNFTPCNILLHSEQGLPEMRFASVENAYMAWKTLDLEARKKIQTMTPGEAKRFTHEEGFPLRPDYSDDKRVRIMLYLTRKKYSDKNPDLKEKLISTGDSVIIEGNV